MVSSSPLAFALLAPDLAYVYETISLNPFRGASMVLVVSDVLEGVEKLYETLHG